MISDIDLRDWEKSITAARRAVDSVDLYPYPVKAMDTIDAFIDKVEALVYINDKQVAALFKEKS